MNDFDTIRYFLEKIEQRGNEPETKRLEAIADKLRRQAEVHYASYLSKYGECEKLKERIAELEQMIQKGSLHN